jgi:hypothetical protein
MRVACIGSRDMDARQVSWCRQIGALITANGFELHSGNALGADQAFASGANQEHPELVYLHLPWASYEVGAVQDLNHVSVYPFGNMKFYVDIAAEVHPRWNFLKQAVRKLHARNSSILVPNQTNVDVCIAWPSAIKGGGGTGQGMRIAKSRGIKLIDLRETEPSQVVTWLGELR